MKILHMVSYVLLWVGGLNWGTIGLLKLNLVEMVTGAGTPVTKILYIAVGLAAVYTLVTHKNDCKVCAEKMKDKPDKDEEE